MSSVSHLSAERLLEKEPDLRDALNKFVGWGSAGIKLIACEKIKANVFRIRFEDRAQIRSIIAKGMDALAARSVEMTANRWLPAVDLNHIGPSLLAIAPQSDDQHVWHLYRDFGPCTLNAVSPAPRQIALVIDCLAKMHGRFADHPILADCRIWAANRCTNGYTTHVMDAIRSVESCLAMTGRRSSGHGNLLDNLLRNLEDLLRDAPRREQTLIEFGGPQTLLHGDLWPSNILVYGTDHGQKARFIDWERVGVGVVSYDLSTILSRFLVELRPMILEQYRRSAEPFGINVPDVEISNLLFDTAEKARIVYCINCSALAILEGEAEWGYVNLREQLSWLNNLNPFLPVNSKTQESLIL